MFIIGKIISDGETNFTQHKYNKLQKISAKNKSAKNKKMLKIYVLKIKKVQIWDHLQFNYNIGLQGLDMIDTYTNSIAEIYFYLI